MTPDAIVVGSGPNGLAAAVTLARAGLSVRVHERAATVGGAARTLELTLPGFRHDVGSAVHAMADTSPFFRRIGLADRVRLLTPALSYAHPLDGGRAGLAWRDLDRAVDDLGIDGPAWRRMLGPLVRDVDRIGDLALHPLLRVPRYPLAAAGYGLRVLEQGSQLWDARFRDEVAPALLTGVMAHPVHPMPAIAPAAAGLVLAAQAHAGGWAIPEGGSQAIADALAADLVAHGGEIVTGSEVTALDDLAPTRAMLFDTSLRALVRIVGARLPAGWVRRARRFRFGDGVAKIDYALSDPVPWAAGAVREAGTVHLGGTRAALAASERDVAAGRHPEDPYVLASQPTILDPTRAPAGRHTLWAYTHVPHGSDLDRTEAVTAQIERFAPGFRDTVLATASLTAREVERVDPNLVGGDISAGGVTLAQLLARPRFAADPWRTPASGVYLCSSSAAPGPGVHGMVGYLAARSALRREFALPDPLETRAGGPC